MGAQQNIGVRIGGETLDLAPLLVEIIAQSESVGQFETFYGAVIVGT